MRCSAECSRSRRLYAYVDRATLRVCGVSVLTSSSNTAAIMPRLRQFRDDGDVTAERSCAAKGMTSSPCRAKSVDTVSERFIAVSDASFLLTLSPLRVVQCTCSKGGSPLTGGFGIFRGCLRCASTGVATLAKYTPDPMLIVCSSGATSQPSGT